MRVLFVSPGVRYAEDYPFELQGSESQILGISRQLAKAGHEIYITGLFGSMYSKLPRETHKIQFINVPLPDFHDDWIYQLCTSFLYSLAVCDAVNRVDPEILCLSDRFSGYFPSRLDFPKVFTTHNPEAMDFNRGLSIEQNKLNVVLFEIKKRVEEAVMSRCDVVIALTRSINNCLRENGFVRTRVIPNGVDEEKYRNSGDGGFVLYAGRLAKVKGLPLLVDAFSRLDGHRSARLVLVGSGPEEQKLRKLAKLRGIENRVEFVPLLPKEELGAYLSACSVFVLPSLYESLPVTMLEAMASAKAVIASNIPGPADVIVHGATGLLFERGNAVELRKYLDQCLRDAKFRSDLGMKARLSIEADYTFGRISRLYEETFAGILSDKL